MTNKKFIGKVLLLLSTALTLLPSHIMAGGTATLSIEDFTISAGETKTMIIDLTNPSDAITLVQFDLYLPAGLSIATDGEE